MRPAFATTLEFSLSNQQGSVVSYIFIRAYSNKSKQVGSE